MKHLHDLNETLYDLQLSKILYYLLLTAYPLNLADFMNIYQ